MGWRKGKEKGFLGKHGGSVGKASTELLEVGGGSQMGLRIVRTGTWGEFTMFQELY